MIIYAINRKSDNKKFAKWDQDGKTPHQFPKWADKPQFYRDISSVLHTVSWLSTKEIWEDVYREKRKNSPILRYSVPSRNVCGYKAYKPKVLKYMLKQYEIVKYDIAINGTESISAEKYFKRQVKS